MRTNLIGGRYLLYTKSTVVVTMVKTLAIYSPWIRTLGRGGIGGLVVRVLIQNVGVMGSNPT